MAPGSQRSDFEGLAVISGGSCGERYAGRGIDPSEQSVPEYPICLLNSTIDRRRESAEPTRGQMPGSKNLVQMGNYVLRSSPTEGFQAGFRTSDTAIYDNFPNERGVGL